jgi:hypothetical protein
MAIHHRFYRLIATSSEAQRRTQDISTTEPLSQRENTEHLAAKKTLSADTFRGLLRILNSPIILESNRRITGRETATENIPEHLGQTTTVQFLKSFLSKIPDHYDPKVYLHGSLANDKKLSGFAKNVPPHFNDVDILIVINRHSYDTETQEDITNAIQNSYGEIVAEHSTQTLVQRGFQKRTLIGTPENRYDYRGAIVALGPRSGNNMMELKILALGPDPIANRSDQLASQCSSSLDSLMIGPLNPLLAFEIATPRHATMDMLSRKNAADFYDALGPDAPQKISKYFYSDADIQLVETQNIISAPGWNSQLSLTRLAKQAMSPGGIRIGSPLIIESIAKNITDINTSIFEEDLARYLRVHFPNAESAEKASYCIVLERLLSALGSTLLANDSLPKIEALQHVVAKYRPKKSKTPTIQTQFKLDPASLISNWCKTIAIIRQHSPDGKIQRDALHGMSLYLQLWQHAQDGRIDKTTLPKDTLCPTLAEVELRIVDHFKQQTSFLSETLLPALAKIPSGLFATENVTAVTIANQADWQTWAHTINDPIIIPFYERITTADTQSEWTLTCTRISHLGPSLAAKKWMESGLRLIFKGNKLSDEWRPVLTAVQSGKTAQLALIDHAPVTTQEHAQLFTTLCPDHNDAWQQRLATDTSIPPIIREQEALKALQHLSETPNLGLPWTKIQLILLLIEQVQNLPTSVLSGLSNRIERKPSGKRPDTLRLNLPHLRTIPNSHFFCATVFARIHDSPTIDPSLLSDLETLTIQKISNKDMPLGPFKAVIKSRLEKESHWKERLRPLSPSAHYALLSIATDCSLSRESMSRFIDGRDLCYTTLTTMPEHLFKALKSLRTGLDLLIQSDQNSAFLNALSKWAPLLANTAFAEQTFELMALPDPEPENFHDFEVLCLLAKKLGLLHTTDSKVTHLLGKWFAEVRPKAAENTTITCNNVLSSTNKDLVMPVGYAFQLLFILMAQTGQFGFLIQCLKHHIEIPHPLKVSEVLLRSEELTHAQLTQTYRNSPYLNDLSELLQIAWSQEIVPFLYHLCVTDQFNKGSYTYIDSNGIARLVPVNIAATLQKIIKPELISEPEWRELNIHTASILIEQITHDTLSILQREQAIALTSSIVFNALCPSTRSEPCSHDIAKEVILGLTPLICEQPTSSAHQNTSKLFFESIIHYLGSQSGKNDPSLLLQWISTYPALSNNQLFQNTLATELPNLFDMATTSIVLQTIVPPTD